ncbi:uncharacterized protein CTRU02_206268 [Colletotrichum truncatum]|uniref:Uncharacterized protein n=1 Tax=Colletotrichum truncatum TaxID=5467 RepID=A0ACC3Z6C3_COLTU|nr:uncharacterized protein CTRU02_09893 [Colletotrichum truncatum]KAF6788080.1 hypothetical protein CTRU02_09893 [Colletotrichum truncatum]
MSSAAEQTSSTRKSVEKVDLSSPALQEGDRRSSLSDADTYDTDDSDDSDLTLERHEDHMDRVYYSNPFELPGEEWHWFHDWLDTGIDTFANGKLYEEPTTQNWLAKLHLSHRENVAQLLKVHDFLGICRIPLFEADNGDEYQIKLSTSCTRLPIICCPDILRGRKWDMKDLIFEFRSRDDLSLDARKGKVPGLPKFALDLGSLEVRTTATPERHYLTSGERVTECTGYQVIVDVLGDGMPLWITAARRQLQTRNTGAVNQPKSVYPIFKDHMLGDNGGFDTACFLPSIHQLPTSKPETTEAIFRQACELVRKTRVSVDPVAVIIPKETVDEYFANHPTQTHVLGINFKQLLGGVKSRIWTFLGK